LKQRGFDFVGPAYGRLAAGDWGLGRLAEIDDILGTIHQVLGRGGDLAGRRIVVSAGGTVEPIDPVRHIGNRSSGKMGYALAEAARDRGATVILVSAPTALIPPVGVEVVQVQTTVQMRDAIAKAIVGADALLMAAAPADFRPRATAESKIKKGAETLTLELVENPDILSEVKGNFVRVGFAAESENLVENARGKLKRKNLDLIVANDITATDSGFGADTNRVVIIDRSGKVESLPLLSKREVADRILDKVVRILSEQPIQPRGITLRLGSRTGEGSSYHINIPDDKTSFFPNYRVPFIIETDIGELETHIVPKHTKYSKDHFHLAKWFKSHPELKPKDKLVIEIIEPKKKYSLHIEEEE
ncbi:MAG: bifunctional phosphopantothenoylcysteine decarboxylase/phosphopantothenate--cysteine ligase CoaBC, partial [Dehalococcoidia bacterium]|nr:bifunctional phosphopantothenoylcysteine decarboxylase/phosphopantothenate--cysteine ligase CoaBC [Dehalococcoidia bacterium]